MKNLHTRRTNPNTNARCVMWGAWFQAVCYGVDLSPAMLVTTTVQAQVPTDCLIKPLCLIVGLWMITRSETDIYIQVTTKSRPHLRRELYSPVRDNIFGKTIDQNTRRNRAVAVSMVVGNPLSGTNWQVCRSDL